MLVALGFVLCALLVLLFGRAFWNLAVRLGASRNTRQIPVAMLELQADRDRLRVEHAMMSRKLELRLQDIKLRMTEQMAEVTRNRNRVQLLVQDVAVKAEGLASRDREIERLTAQLETYKADVVSCTETIKHLTTTTLTLQEDNRKLTSRLAETQSTLKLIDPADSKWVQQLGPGAPPLAAVSVEPGPKTAEDRIKQRIHELTNLSAEISNKAESLSQPLPAAPEATAPQLSSQISIDQKLADAEREANAMTEELRALDQMLQVVTSPAKPGEAVEPVAEPVKSGPVANVISLAQRIKALQFGVKE
jgi:hypothetical protein